MLDWVRRLRRASRKLTLPSREASDGRTNQQLNLSKLTPSELDYLAKFSLSQKLAADLLDELAVQTPDEKLSESVRALAKNQEERFRPVLRAIAKKGLGAKDELVRFEDEFFELTSRITGKGFYENLMALYVVFGILDDFYARLASVQSSSTKNMVLKTLSDYPFNEFLKNLLIEKTADDEELRDLLAMFGRSLVADCLLHVINVLEFEEIDDSDPVEFRRDALRRIEPLTRELVSNHAARMDDLGMSA
ncbi:MAG: ferritin-like fold-containing protein [Microbacteriaceae bacterium]|nr:ferritin-like fold-containing protein [Microbacteriaceae bacterium]MDR9443805.1 ferritin-like fold-containing protein [Microbacteriaceae bacterium]